MPIFSEIGTLKCVLLHEPVHTLSKLTPDNCQALLFDDVLWVERAVEEHRKFAEVLRQHGAEVLLVSDLLETILTNDQARRWLLAERLARTYYHSAFRDDLFAFLYAQPSNMLVQYLTGGLTRQAFASDSDSLVAQLLDAHDFILPPLPNHLFTRDTSCWIGHGITINAMRFPARTAEALNISAIYRFHPIFQQIKPPIWYDDSEDRLPLPSLEGGDVMVLNEQTVIIGLSQRTSAQAVEVLAKQLFKGSHFNQVIAVDIPKKRAAMHLDTLLTMVDHATFCTAIPLSQLRAWSIEKTNGQGRFQVTALPSLEQALQNALSAGQVDCITLPGDFFAQQRAQWNDASNVLAVSPCKVIAYQRNVEINQALRAHGIDVIEIDGAELGRGRGGARCMSCPIDRETIA